MMNDFDEFVAGNLESLLRTAQLLTGDRQERRLARLGGGATTDSTVPDPLAAPGPLAMTPEGAQPKLIVMRTVLLLDEVDPPAPVRLRLARFLVCFLIGALAVLPTASSPGLVGK